MDLLTQVAFKFYIADLKKSDESLFFEMPIKSKRGIYIINHCPYTSDKYLSCFSDKSVLPE